MMSHPAPPRFHYDIVVSIVTPVLAIVDDYDECRPSPKVGNSIPRVLRLIAADLHTLPRLIVCRDTDLTWHGVKVAADGQGGFYDLTIDRQPVKGRQDAADWAVKRSEDTSVCS